MIVQKRRCHRNEDCSRNDCFDVHHFLLNCAAEQQRVEKRAPLPLVPVFVVGGPEGLQNLGGRHCDVPFCLAVLSRLLRCENFRRNPVWRPRNLPHLPDFGERVIECVVGRRQHLGGFR